MYGSRCTEVGKSQKSVAARLSCFMGRKDSIGDSAILKYWGLVQGFLSNDAKCSSRDKLGHTSYDLAKSGDMIALLRACVSP